MRASWFGDFWDALPDALQGFWRFGDPSAVGDGWWGIVILLIWGVGLTAVPLFIAKQTYGKHEWVSATAGVVAGTSAFWWAFGILPSAWIYYVDSNKEILEGAIIPSSMRLDLSWLPWVSDPEYTLDVATNLYEVIRDSVVMVETGVAIGLTIFAALRIQKKLPKSLVPGEVKPESGGYK